MAGELDAGRVDPRLGLRAGHDRPAYPGAHASRRRPQVRHCRRARLGADDPRPQLVWRQRVHRQQVERSGHCWHRPVGLPDPQPGPVRPPIHDVPVRDQHGRGESRSCGRWVAGSAARRCGSGYRDLRPDAVRVADRQQHPSSHTPHPTRFARTRPGVGLARAVCGRHKVWWGCVASVGDVRAELDAGRGRRDGRRMQVPGFVGGHSGSARRVSIRLLSQTTIRSVSLGSLSDSAQRSR